MASSPSSHPYIIRRLRAADLPAISAIAALTYGGEDWIVAAFPRWIADPLSTCAVAIEHRPTGRVVALEVIRLVDGGATAWLEALRTHRDHGRRGLGSCLQRICVLLALRHPAALAQAEPELREVFTHARWARVQRIRYATGDTNMASLRLGAKCGLSPSNIHGFLLIKGDEAISRLATRVRGKLAELQRLRPASSPSPTSSSSSPAMAENTASLLRCNAGMLPPGGHLMLDWKVVDVEATSGGGGGGGDSEHSSSRTGGGQHGEGRQSLPSLETLLTGWHCRYFGGNGKNDDRNTASNNDGDNDGANSNGVVSAFSLAKACEGFSSPRQRLAVALYTAGDNEGVEEEGDKEQEGNAERKGGDDGGGNRGNRGGGGDTGSGGGGASYEALLGFMAVYLEEALADRECQSIHFFLGNRWMPQLAKDDLVDASFIDTLYPGMRYVALLEGDEEEALRVSAPVLLEQGSAAAVLGRGGGGNGVGGAAAWRRCRLLGVVSAAAAVLGALWGVGTE